MIVDIFTYNGEEDILEIRLNILDDYVDQFIICEARETFSGKPKPLYYENQKERFKKWEGKIKYYIIDEYGRDKEIMAMADVSPNVPKGGAENWHREFYQKESIKKALTHLHHHDVCFIGDVDEIWDAVSLLPFTRNDVVKLKLDVYSYYLNNHSNENFWGTIVSKYKNIEGACLNHLRTNKIFQTIIEYGWHFTSCGGYDLVRRKLSDSYTRESYWTEEIEDNLENNLLLNRDFLGRPFEYVIDESELPEFIIENKKQYAHLFKS